MLSGMVLHDAWDFVSSTVCGYLLLSCIGLVLVLIALVVCALCPVFELYHLVNRTPYSRSTSAKNLIDVETKALDEIASKCNATYVVKRKLVPVTFGKNKQTTISVYIHDVQFKSKTDCEPNTNMNGNGNGESRIGKESSDRASAKPKRHGQPIVLMHGMMCGPTYFRPNIRALLDQECEVHCISLPGFCTADANLKGEPKLVDLSKDDLLLFYMQFFVEYFTFIFPSPASKKPILFGHSFGGFLTCNLAVHHPELFAGVILGNVAGMFPFLSVRGIYWAWMFKWGFPNRFARQFGYALNSLLFFVARNCDPSAKFVGLYDILQMTCTENFSDLLIAKYIDLWFTESTWNHSLISDLITVKIPIAQISSDDDDIIPLYQARVLEEISRRYICIDPDQPANAAMKSIPAEKASSNHSRLYMRLYPVSGCWHHPIRAIDFNSVLSTCLDDMLANSAMSDHIKGESKHDDGRSVVIVNEANRKVLKGILRQYGDGYFSKLQTLEANRVALQHFFDALHMMASGHIVQTDDSGVFKGLNSRSFDLSK
jgi:pimeloyl-ACP methyl ester carboxylesterase